MQHASLPSLIQFLPGSFRNSLWNFHRSSLPCLMHRWTVGIFQLHRRSHPPLRSSKRLPWILLTSTTTGLFRTSPSSRSSSSVPPLSKSLDTWSVTIYSRRCNQPTRNIVPRRRRQSKWCLTSTSQLTQALSCCSAFSISPPLSMLSHMILLVRPNTVTTPRDSRSSGSSLTWQSIRNSRSTPSKLKSHLFIVDSSFSVFHSCTSSLSIAFCLCRIYSLAGATRRIQMSELNWIERS